MMRHSSMNIRGSAMTLPQDTLSLSEFERNNSSLLEAMKTTKRPLVLTVDGRAEFVVLDADSYRKMEAQALRFDTIEAIKEGVADMEAGRGEEASVVFARMERFREYPLSLQVRGLWPMR